MNCRNKLCGYMCKKYYSHRGQQVPRPQEPGMLSRRSVWLEQREMVGEVAR